MMREPIIPHKLSITAIQLAAPIHISNNAMDGGPSNYK